MSSHQRYSTCSFFHISQLDWLNLKIDFDILLFISFPFTGMHPVRHHVSEGEKGFAHGPQLLLWSRERLHHTSWRCKLGLQWNDTVLLDMAHILKAAPLPPCSSSSASTFPATPQTQWEKAGIGTWTSSPSSWWLTVFPVPCHWEAENQFSKLWLNIF